MRLAVPPPLGHLSFINEYDVSKFTLARHTQAKCCDMLPI